MKEWARRNFASKEEYYLYINLVKHLNGWNGEKRREPGRLLMAKRRKQGLTQAAQRKYLKRNKHVVSMYNKLMELNPKLVRKGRHNFGRGVLND